MLRLFFSPSRKSVAVNPQFLITLLRLFNLEVKILAFSGVIDILGFTGTDTRRGQLC
jgi:hypothetical protein